MDMVKKVLLVYTSNQKCLKHFLLKVKNTALHF
jgi:hypothetical protein